MISTAPGSYAAQVLAEVVRYPGELTVADIAERLHPGPRHSGPFTPASHTAHRAALAEHRAGADERQERVSRIVRELVRLGLVERRGAPRLAPWTAKVLTERGVDGMLALAHPRWPQAPAGLTAHARMVSEVAKGPLSVRALLGDSPSGDRKRTYQELVGWGVLVAPGQRWPTEKGRALVGAPL